MILNEMRKSEDIERKKMLYIITISGKHSEYVTRNVLTIIGTYRSVIV